MGGMLSLGQAGLDAAARNDLSVLTGNPTKLGIASISIAFDLLFMYQHYYQFGPGVQPQPVPAPALVQPSAARMSGGSSAAQRRLMGAK